MSDLAIAGRIVLVVEDEFFVADSLRLYLEQQGAVVVGPVATVDDALEVIGRAERLDAGIVDVNLQGKRAFPVADALAARGVPSFSSPVMNGIRFPSGSPPSRTVRSRSVLTRSSGCFSPEETLAGRAAMGRALAFRNAPTRIEHVL